MLSKVVPQGVESVGEKNKFSVRNKSMDSYKMRPPTIYRNIWQGDFQFNYKPHLLNAQDG